MTLRLKQNCLAICGCEVKVIATHTVNGQTDEFESGYDYDGYMELQQGCSYDCGWQLYDEGIVWPD